MQRKEREDAEEEEQKRLEEEMARQNPEEEEDGEKKPSFTGIASELNSLIKKMTNMPDLLLFIDFKADGSAWDDKDTML